MPPLNKGDVNLVKEYKDIIKEVEELGARLKKGGLLGLNENDLKVYDAARKKATDLATKIGEIEAAGIAAAKNIGKLNKNIQETSSAGKSVTDTKLDNFFKSIAKQGADASAVMGTIVDKIIDLNKEGKGGGDYAKGLQGIVDTETEILGALQSKEKFMTSDIKGMKEKAKIARAQLVSSGKATKEELQRLDNQIDQLDVMRKQQLKQEEINKALEESNALLDKAKGIWEKLTSGPLVAVLTILEGIKQVFNKVRDRAKEVNTGLGGSAGFSAKWAANMELSYDMTQRTAIAASGLGKNVREAAIASAGASNDFSLMENSALAINDAVVAIQSGLSADQVAELAQTMSEVTDASREGASAVLSGAISLAEMNNVAPSKVMEDMASNSAVLAEMTDGSAESMAKLAVFARKAGFELSQMSSVADGLLSIEESLNAEFKASALLNKDINLDMARQAALMNDNEGMIAAIQDELGGMDFASMNRLQRKALADAVGVGVGDLGRIMARSGEELEGTMEERMLKNSGALVKEGLIHTDRFGQMVSWLQVIAAAVSLSSLMKLGKGLGLGKFLKGKGPKAPKPVKTGNLGKLNQSGIPGLGSVDDAAKAASKNPGLIAKTMQKGKQAMDAVKNTTKSMTGAVVDATSKVAGKTGLGKITSWMSKNLGKQALKKIPVLGAIPAVAFAGYRAMQGDFAGAGLEIASGASNLANLVAPGFGSAGALAIDGLLMARDMGVDVGFARGGVVPKTGTYMVGERGPEMVAMGKGSHVVPNHRLGGGYASGTNTDVMQQTNEKLDTLIALMSNVDTNTNNTATGVSNINIRTGR